MSLDRDTRRYEDWLRTQCDVVEADLALKHHRMGESAFVFLRATYYRWAHKIVDWCAELAGAPQVLAVGDVHTENFGTWRDAQGRLVWGINDFDDAAIMPYAFDLVRLATSAILAPNRLLRPGKICAAIAKGYLRGLQEPRPALLDEREIWMRGFVLGSDKQRERFWTEVDAYPATKPPRDVVAHFAEVLPASAKHIRFANRVAGGGGLGRPRFVAIATWQGGRIIREAKALVPSGWDWARGKAGKKSPFMEIATARFRSPDPFLATKAGFIFRRLAPDSRKVELGDQAGKRLNAELLGAMGFDVGAIHAADKRAAKQILPHLRDREATWLEAAAERAAALVTEEYDVWRKQSAEK